LQAFAARGVISKWGIPKKIEFVDRLAKTSAGKIDKKLLRETLRTLRNRTITGCGASATPQKLYRRN
jgi:acyl-CoA synthetase (AMP-forming)/AMP-acid ligase II